jgi:glutamate-1-semialdehyde 2,1-aminomutase
MEHAQDTFISSTFWTERIGPTAALATLAEMQATNAPEIIEGKGQKLQKDLASLGTNLGLKLETAGMPALTTFTIEGSTPQELRTLITSELLKSHYLGGTAVYVSLAHEENILEGYLEALGGILKTHLSLIQEGELSSVLPNGLIQKGFTRLA